MFTLNFFNAFSSRSCNTTSAITGDKDEPTGVTKVCLYILPLKLKNVEDKINCNAKMNSSIGMLVFFSIVAHLLEMPSIARSWGMLVNSDITSNDNKISVLLIFLPERTLYKSKLFLTCLSSYVKLVEIIFCKKEAIGYKAVLMDKTLILGWFF